MVSSPSSRSVSNGGERADVRVGETVTFEAVAEVPPGAGTLVRAEWDFDGAGAWPTVDDAVDGSQTSVTLTAHAHVRRARRLLSVSPRDRAPRR